MVIILSGPDTYRSRQRLRFFRDGFIKKYDPHGLNIVRLDGTKITADEFRNAVGTTGLLSAKRMVIVERLSAAASKNIVKEIAAELKQRNVPDTVIVFWEEEKESTGRKAKPKTALSMPEAKVEHFSTMRPIELERWVTAEAKRRGGVLSIDSARALIQRTGTDCWRISAELDKIIAYAGRRPVALGDIEALVPSVVEGRIFDFVDAISERNAAAALRELQDELDSGESPQYVIAMLMRQVRMLLQVRDLLDGNGGAKADTSSLGIHPYVLRKVTQQSKNFTLKNLVALYRHLVRIDEQLKTGSEDPSAVLQLFVLEATGVAAA